MKPVCEICGDEMFFYFTGAIESNIGVWCCPRKEHPGQHHPLLPETKKFTHREELLKEATEIITKARNASYGEPDQDFTRTAKLWTTFLQGRSELTDSDVAIMMILLKISRLSWNPTHKDSWLDIAGYAACGYETVNIARPKSD
jgi:hypothetical protein